MECLLRWQPEIGLPRHLDTPVVCNDYEHGFRLILAEPSANGRAFDVRFAKPLAFRSANESYRLKLIESLTDLPWPTFKVEHSEWVEWFHVETRGIYQDWNVQHFVFLGEEVIEVLSTVEPDFAEIERPSNLGY